MQDGDDFSSGIYSKCIGTGKYKIITANINRFYPLFTILSPEKF
jgi:hypothetical protein